MSELETKLEELKTLIGTINDLNRKMTMQSFDKNSMDFQAKRSLMPNGRNRNYNTDRLYNSLISAQAERKKKYDDLLKSLEENQEKMSDLMVEKRILDNDVSRLQKQQATAERKSLKTAQKAAEEAARAANTRTREQKAANTRAATKAAQAAKNALKSKTPARYRKSRRNTRRSTRRH